MKLTYDPRHNIGYLRFQEPKSSVETIHITDQLNVDIAPDGTIYGIELLNANAQLRGENGSTFLVVNEALDEQSELTLSL